MNALLNTLASIIGFLVFVGILSWLITAATRNLNPGLPKVGRGKNRKGGGDAAADWTRKQVFWASRQNGRLCWNVIKRPFR